MAKLKADEIAEKAAKETGDSKDSLMGYAKVAADKVDDMGKAVNMVAGMSKGRKKVKKNGDKKEDMKTQKAVDSILAGESSVREAVIGMEDEQDIVTLQRFYDGGDMTKQNNLPAGLDDFMTALTSIPDPGIETLDPEVIKNAGFFSEKMYGPTTGEFARILNTFANGSTNAIEANAWMDGTKLNFLAYEVLKFFSISS